MADEASTQSISNDNSSNIHHSFSSDQSIETICQEVSNNELNDQKPLSILDDRHQEIKVDENFILKLPKDSKNVSREFKNSCKVLHFSSEWNFEEVLAAIGRLNPQEYPNLFVFVIELKYFEFLRLAASKKEPTKKQPNKKLKRIKKMARKFGSTRPLILQLTSEEENVSKFRYKEENSNDFMPIDHEKTNFWDIKDFPTFFCDFLDGKFDNFNEFEEKFYELLSQVHKTSLLLKFWTTLNLSEETHESIILEMSKRGTKAEFLVALDAPFEDNMGILRNRAEQYLPALFPNDDNNYDALNSPSVLLTAVENQNKDVIDYLITFWTHLIQQLPFEHKVRISSAAFNTNQLDVLCDLLDIADFPFPKDFKVDDEQNHEKLSKIINERSRFAETIKAENYEEINKFINSNLSLRIAYNPVNKSALQQAVDVKLYNVYFYLKSFGFETSEFEDPLTSDELDEAIQSKIQQRRKNINEALTEDQKSVNLLCNRSLIHNRRIDKDQEAEYRRKIRKWYEDISKIKFGTLFLDVAASCEDLKIIFDFGNCSVENLSFQSSGTMGSMYPSSKWIFIGAKLSDMDGNVTKQREQQIKGVLAHELCHYVMKLVYENQENPYYKIMVKIAEMFEEIVKVINKWPKEDSENPHDECNGIISSVFKLYDIKDFHPELIVRIVQILAEFDDDEDKSKHLQDKYKILFDFWENHVIPDLRTFDLRSREAVRKMNRMLELLEFIKSELYYFNESKDIKILFDQELTIVTSNVPTLLLNDIHNYLHDKTGDLFDTENVFVDPNVLENKEIFEDFKKLLQENPKLNILVDCSSELPENINDYKGLKTICVVSTEAQHDQLLKIMNNPKVTPTKLEINYNWSDLKQESQELLLNHEVNFQDWTGLSLLELLMPEQSFKEPESSESYKKAKNQAIADFSQIVDDELLNLMVNDSDIFIDVLQKNEELQHQGSINSEKRNFEFLFIEREFIKKSKQEIKLEGNQTIKLGLYVNREGQAALVPNISQDQLLFDVKDKSVVLISDIAGNGKSWVMKNFAVIFRQDDDSIKWVTFVDLKQFIDEFKAHEGEPEFSSFVAENILKLEKKFEAKIFKKLYKNGKVFILFDGFDEIAPDCAEFVSKLAQNFQQNGGNKLWIATRDYFEVDLQQKLITSAVYKIRELNFGESISLIAQIWVLMENGGKFESFEDFENFVANPDEQYSKYLNKAHQIVLKLFSKWLSPVGMPHLLTMVAECYKDGVDLNLSKIFEKFMDRQYEKWTYEKGQIRKTANIRSQRFNMSFWKLHQYYAIAIIFPEFLKLLFPGCDISEWPVEEIIACGLLSSFGNQIFFVHETYGEFFVADLVANGLKNSKINENVLEIFVKILTNQKYVVIRGFLNDMIDDLTMEKIQPQIKNFIDCFDENSNYKFENFVIENFVENQDKFLNFTIKILKSESYERKNEILQNSSSAITVNSYDSRSFSKFLDFIFSDLTVKDLENLIPKTGMFQGILLSSLKFEVFENFISKVEQKTNKNTIRNGFLKIGTFGFGRGNIFHHLSQSSKFNLQTFQKTLQICKKFLSFAEICELITHCNEHNQNILYLCFVNNSSKLLKQLWQETEKFFSPHGSSKQFKQLLMQEDSNGIALLHLVAPYPNVKFHEDLWEVLLQTFKNREELKDMIIKIDKTNFDSFIHKLIAPDSIHDVIEYTFKILKLNFTNFQYKEIIKSKGRWDIYLVQTAVIWSKNISIHRLIWKVVRDACNSDAEFLKILKFIDTNGKNILQCCSQSSSSEIFEFIIEELERLVKRDEIRKMLSLLDNNGYSIFHCCAHENIFPELHMSVWKMMKKYFDKSEIVNLIHQVDVEYDENLLFFALIRNNLQILEFTWNEIKKLLSHDEQVKYLKTKNMDGKNLLERTSVRKFDENIEKDKIEWVMNLFKEYNIEVHDHQLSQSSEGPLLPEDKE